ncbi:MAG: hypothetical protein MUF04_02870 [Akkermansiaceae bacterium]|nr:hypothetical protein [Akkermansiaceae bacterium]
MKFAEEIEICLRSRFTVVWISSYEEERIVASLKELCDRTKRRLLTWDIAACFKVASDTPGAPSPPDAKDPLTALEAISKAEAGTDAVFVLKDFLHCLDKQPLFIRQLRNLAQSL